MAKFGPNPHVCRTCRLSAPHVEMRLVKGMPVGECQECRKIKDQGRRTRKSFYNGLYDSTSKLTGANAKTLVNLKFGIYPLISNVSKANVGYLVVQDGRIVSHLWGITDVFHYEVYSVALYHGDRNVLIGAEPMELTDSAGNALSSDAIASGIAPKSVQDALVMFDAKLRDKCMRSLRAEVIEAKRANAAIARLARANNLKTDT